MSAKFLLLVYKQMSFWVSMFLLSSSCEKHTFFGGGVEGLVGRKLYKPFNDLENLAVQTFILCFWMGITKACI